MWYIHHYDNTIIVFQFASANQIGLAEQLPGLSRELSRLNTTHVLDQPCNQEANPLHDLHYIIKYLINRLQNVIGQTDFSLNFTECKWNTIHHDQNTGFS